MMELGYYALFTIGLGSYLLRYMDRFQSMLTMFLALFGLQWYKIESRDEVDKISSRIDFASVKVGNNYSGWTCGRFFIAKFESRQIELLTTRGQYEKFIETKSEDVDTDESKLPGKIKRMVREGNYSELSYYTTTYETEREPYDFQAKIIEQTLAYYRKHNNAKIFIHGPPGSCKSFISILMAKKLTEAYEIVHFCDCFNPTDPGDSFDALYCRTIKKTKPLVVILEECDIIINKIHNNLIEKHVNYPVSIYDKVTWNLFFDRFDRGIYPYVILILTSNKSLDYFDSLDPSYLRSGRIDLKFETPNKGGPATINNPLA